jgi:hypothetical protein
MLRKTLIILCLLMSFATLALWADSFRPRYILADLESRARQQEGAGGPSADPSRQDAQTLFRKAKDANCDASARVFTFGQRTLEISLSHRLVSPPSRPDAANGNGAISLTIAPGGPQTDVQSPGILGFRYTRIFAPGEPVPRGGMTMGSKAGFYFARVGFGGTNPGVMYSLAFPAWRVSLLFLLGLAFFGVRPLRRYRRRRRGLCVKCAYDLRGAVSDRCPECGTPIRSLKSEI